MNRERVPVYLAHVQVVDRADPPTVRYAALGLWWTDLFSMHDHFVGSRTRPRETRTAAYYNTAMFRGVDELVRHIGEDGPGRLRQRLEEEGLPRIYW